MRGRLHGPVAKRSTRPALRCLIAGPSLAGNLELASHLRREGMDPVVSSTASEAVAAAWNWRPHVVIAEAVPTATAVLLARRLRELSQAPLLLVDARADPAATIALLDAGADAIVGAPLDLGELAARIRAALARLERSRPSAEHERDIRQVGTLVLHTAARDAFCSGRAVRFTVTEFDLLDYFMTHTDVVLSRGELLDAVWGQSSTVGSNVIDRHVRALRRKLGPECARSLETVFGSGYRFRA